MKSIKFFLRQSIFSPRKQIILQIFFTQIAGKHYDVYEAYYRSLDPKNTNVIQAMDAAKFLKKSGLSDVILSRVSKLFIYGAMSFFGRFSSYLYRSRDHKLNDISSPFFRFGTCLIIMAVDFSTRLDFSLPSK